ncbi:MAG: hypothetical protein OM95_00735 [Bdellovibrio sp. ArHS]|nr:MAG: hypothetical protein OM95_00735 [Bdellovibrio sp. ArHS]
MVAFAGLSLGYIAHPFKNKVPEQDHQEVAQFYAKAHQYFAAGNFEGALEASEKIRRPIPPRYADIEQLQRKARGALAEYQKKLKDGKLNPTHVDRLPAALRDSYFDARIEADQGRCRAAYDHMAPVSRYLNNREHLEIFKHCRLTKNKSK